MPSKRILLGGLIGAAMSASAAAGSPHLKAWVVVTELDGQVQLDSMASADQAGALTYSIRVERVSAAGTSSTRQGGKVTTEAGQPVVLSRNRVNAVDDGTLRVRLEVTGANGETATDVVEIGDP